MAIHRFKAGGDDWICGAPDHSAFCRICYRIDPKDEVFAAMLANVEAGLMEIVGQDQNTCEPRFRLTAAGEAEAQRLVDGNAEARAIFDEVVEHHTRNN